MKSFQDLGKTFLTESTLFEIKQASLGTDEEICGVIIDNRPIFLENVSADKQFSFMIGAEEYFSRFDDIQCLFHSHSQGTSKESSLDLDCLKECGFPVLIYSPIEDSFNYLDKRSFYFKV